MALALGLAGFVLLPGDLLYAGSTSMAAGLVGLGLFVPIAALRELPLNAAGIAGLSAYLFAYYGSQGGLGDHLLGITVALASVLCISLLGGLASLVVTGLYFVVASLVIQVGIEKVIFSIPVLTGGASGTERLAADPRRLVQHPTDHLRDHRGGGGALRGPQCPACSPPVPDFMRCWWVTSRGARPRPACATGW